MAGTQEETTNEMQKVYKKFIKIILLKIIEVIEEKGDADFNCGAYLLA